jgi:heterotetrameric sarcosine oxidase gamma subunit
VIRCSLILKGGAFVANLMEKSAGAGLLPVTIGAFVLSEPEMVQITSIMPFYGQEEALSAVLTDAYGAAFPKPNRTTGRNGTRMVWSGRGQAFLIGAAPVAGLTRYAALSDQSDAWAALRLSGTGVEDVLARLTPLDLNPGVFKRGHTARSQLLHMMASFTRLKANEFEIMVMRSMAGTAVHDLQTAMKGVTARLALPI